MIDVTGPYILVLTFAWSRGGGIATHEMPSFESCKAAIVQLEPVPHINAYCIAKDTTNDQ